MASQLKEESNPTLRRPAKETFTTNQVEAFETKPLTAMILDIRTYEVEGNVLDSITEQPKPTHANFPECYMFLMQQYGESSASKDHTPFICSKYRHLMLKITYLGYSFINGFPNNAKSIISFLCPVYG